MTIQGLWVFTPSFANILSDFHQKWIQQISFVFHKWAIYSSLYGKAASCLERLSCGELVWDSQKSCINVLNPNQSYVIMCSFLSEYQKCWVITINNYNCIINKRVTQATILPNCIGIQWADSENKNFKVQAFSPLSYAAATKVLHRI